VGGDDDPARHAADTLAVSGHLADPAAVALLAESGPGAIAGLVALGTRFDHDGASFALGREAAHSRNRVLHARDATGAEIVRTLTAAVRSRPEIDVAEDLRVEDLAVESGRVVGVQVRDGDGAARVEEAPAVVLATGGIGRAYARTTNPEEATGDGLAMAWRAGARVADVEFVQFHPTALATGADPMPLVTEALRGRGARVVDASGTRFLAAIDPSAELLPRDVVARAITEKLAGGGQVFLDAREAVGEHFPEEFPTVFAACAAAGIDPRRMPIPISPAAHYHMGGIRVDASGRSSLPGLWACGEVACSGVHGANRLASNSLLEALVFGGRVAESVMASPALALASSAAATASTEVPAECPVAVAAIRELMWSCVGLVRDASGLETARRALAGLDREVPPRGEARNLLDVARVVTTAALYRHESRGGHFRRDHPGPSRGWRRRIVLEGGSLEPRFEPVSPGSPAPARAAGER
jgi:L-aspartate oxidase